MQLWKENTELIQYLTQGAFNVTMPRKAQEHTVTEILTSLSGCFFFAYFVGKTMKGPSVTVPHVTASENESKWSEEWILLRLCTEIPQDYTNYETQVTFRDQTSQIFIVVGRTFVTGAITASTHVISPVHIYPSDEKRCRIIYKTFTSWLSAVIYLQKTYCSCGLAYLIPWFPCKNKITLNVYSCRPCWWGCSSTSQKSLSAGKWWISKRKKIKEITEMS